LQAGGNRQFAEVFAPRDAAVTLIERAWAAVEPGDPTGFHQCIAGMGGAHDVLVELTPVTAAATG
jgi:hypothetical protein